MRFFKPVGPDASGSGPGSEGCHQTPEKSGVAGACANEGTVVASTAAMARNLRCMMSLSKVWFLRGRHVGVLVVVVLVLIFGANGFLPLAAAGPIGDGRGPRRGEDAIVLDGEPDLEELAPVIRVEVASNALVLLGVALEALFRVFVIDEAIALHDMQRLG